MKQVIVFIILAFILILILLCISRQINHQYAKLSSNYFVEMLHLAQSPRDQQIARQNLADIPLYVINLPKSTKRRENILKQQSYYNLTNLSIIEAVNGRKIINKLEDTIKMEQDQYDVSFINNDEKASLPEIGCTLSHLKAVKQILNQGKEYGIILEDDVSFDLLPLWDVTIPQLIEKANKIVPDWQAIYLFHSCQSVPDDSLFFDFIKNDCWSNAAYLVNRSGCQQIMNKAYDWNTHRYILDKEQVVPERILADLYIPGLIHSYCYHKKLIIPNNNFEEMNSTIHTDHTDLHVSSTYKALQPYYQTIIDTIAIPKTIHIISFNKPEIEKTWTKFTDMHPDWQIKIWTDTTNYYDKLFSTIYDQGGIVVNGNYSWSGLPPPISNLLSMEIDDNEELLFNWIAAVPKHPYIKLIIDNNNVDLCKDVYNQIKKFLDDKDINFSKNSFVSLKKVAKVVGPNRAYFIPVIEQLGYIISDGENPDLLVIDVISDSQPRPASRSSLPARLTPRKLLYSGEPWDLSKSDYDILIDTKKVKKYRNNNKPFIYLPFYALSFSERTKVDKTSLPKTKFCAFLYSNDVDFRNRIFDTINTRYKPVDALGRCRNNNYKDNDRNKDNYNDLAVEKYKDYKFVICCENTVQPGYITEKIVSAYLAGAIPIYYGAPDIQEHFNIDSMILISEAPCEAPADSQSPDWLEKLRMIDQDENAYQRMLNTQPFKNEKYFRSKYLFDQLNGKISD